jgi:hypothetical protein
MTWQRKKDDCGNCYYELGVYLIEQVGRGCWQLSKTGEMDHLGVFPTLREAKEVGEDAHVIMGPELAPDTICTDCGCWHTTRAGVCVACGSDAIQVG